MNLIRIAFFYPTQRNLLHREVEGVEGNVNKQRNFYIKKFLSKIFSNRQRQRSGGLNSSFKVKTMYEHLKENGDVRPSDSAQKNGQKQGEIDIKALQQKRAQAEFTRYILSYIKLLHICC